jgi:hypothetical protein
MKRMKFPHVDHEMMAVRTKQCDLPFQFDHATTYRRVETLNTREQTSVNRGLDWEGDDQIVLPQDPHSLQRNMP